MSVGKAFVGQALGAVLDDNEICRLADEHDLIHPFDRRRGRGNPLQGASYDLMLGREYLLKGRKGKLSEQQPDVEVQPGQFILLLSFECLRIPEDVVAHAGLVSKWAQRGLVSLFSPQIDPGFHGHIVVPLFNAGHKPIALPYRERMFTIEFVRTTKYASYSWSENGRKLAEIPYGEDMRMAQADLSDVNRELSALKVRMNGLAQRLDDYHTALDLKQGGSSARTGRIALGVAAVAFVAQVAQLLGAGS